jgi:hypothetical protein
MLNKRMLFTVSAILASAALLWLGPASAFQSSDDTPPGLLKKNGLDLDVRSAGRQTADEVIATGNLIAANEVSPVPGGSVVRQIQLRGVNVQVNDPSLDNIQVFPGFRPFVMYTQSETSIAAFGRNIVAAYNTSANQPLVQLPSGGLQFTQRFLSGFSWSGDDGETWSSGFFPPLPGSIVTFGDPVVDVDRNGNFYFAGLGATGTGLFTIQVNKSTNGGRSWSPAVVVQRTMAATRSGWRSVPILSSRVAITST